MRTSQFAKIQLITKPENYLPDVSGQKAILTTVGMAQNLRISDNFGTRAENVLGSPLPIIAPGFLTTNISMDKATIDGASLRDMINPLYAHLGTTYKDRNLISLSDVSGATATPELDTVTGNEGMYPFVFVLAVQNRVSESYSKSHVNTQREPVATRGGDARVNPIGMYACVLASADISLSSNTAIVLESVQVVARPITGTWFPQAVSEAFATQGDNGMRDLSNSILFGYRG